MRHRIINKAAASAPGGQVENGENGEARLAMAFSVGKAKEVGERRRDGETSMLAWGDVCESGASRAAATGVGGRSGGRRGVRSGAQVKPTSIGSRCKALQVGGGLERGIGYGVSYLAARRYVLRIWDKERDELQLLLTEHPFYNRRPIVIQ